MTLSSSEIAMMGIYRTIEARSQCRSNVAEPETSGSELSQSFSDIAVTDLAANVIAPSLRPPDVICQTRTPPPGRAQEPMPQTEYRHRSSARGSSLENLLDRSDVRRPAVEVGFQHH